MNRLPANRFGRWSPGVVEEEVEDEGGQRGTGDGAAADEVIGDEHLWQVGENAWVLDPDGNSLSLAEAPVSDAGR